MMVHAREGCIGVLRNRVIIWRIGMDRDVRAVSRHLASGFECICSFCIIIILLFPPALVREAQVQVGHIKTGVTSLFAVLLCSTRRGVIARM
ncbi:hypothetical protein GE21DRAFT_1006117 [Neurospora crassa]|nr:hypothetical protein GE21DRAFT_1006117 [Neurospora crassa]